MPNDETTERLHEPASRRGPKRTPLADELVSDDTRSDELTGRDWDAVQAGADTEPQSEELRPARPDPLLEDPTEDRE